MKQLCEKGRWTLEHWMLILVRSSKSTSKWAVEIRLWHSSTSRNKIGKCYTKFDNFTLFNSEPESIKHEFGYGSYVRGKFLKYVKDFKIVYLFIYLFIFN